MSDTEKNSIPSFKRLENAQFEYMGSIAMY
jgi:hypothetical protein